MKTFVPALLGAACAALFATAGAGAAPTIAGDTFEASVVVDDGGGGTVSVGGFSGVAGAVADDIFSAPDLLADFTAGFTDYEVRINWVDADSFDLFFAAFNAIPLDQLSITLSGLDFSVGGRPAAIVGAAFNRAASDVDTYDAGPRMPDPLVSFGARSVTATFPFFPRELAADGPKLRFDVQAVPEPQTWALLAGGLGVVGACAARRRAGRPPVA